MNDSAQTVLQELARAIDAREGNRADFARAVGIGQVYLSQILNGKRPIGRLPLETVRKISDASGMPIERLAAASSPSLAPGGGE